MDVEAVPPPNEKPEEVVAVDVGALPKIDPAAGAVVPKMEPVAAGAKITSSSGNNDASMILMIMRMIMMMMMVLMMMTM